MKIHIEIDTDNASFEDNGFGSESAFIIRNVITKLEGMESSDTRDFLLFDSNGNRVGKCQVK